MVTLDIKNAFNTVPWEGVNKELEELGANKETREIIQEYLKNRTLKIGETEKIRLAGGLPQGSVLGPTLWNMFFNSVLETRLPEGTYKVCYADDLAIIATDKVEKKLVEKMKKAIEVIERKIEKKGLEIEREKTEAVVLYGGRKIKRVKIKAGGREINTKEAIKYLGVWLDRNLTMREHVKKTIEKAERAIKNLARLMRNHGGPEENKRRVLSTVAQSIIMYGCATWKRALRWNKYKKEMEKTQRLLALKVTRAYRTTSTEALMVIGRTMPIELMTQYREASFRRKIKEKKEIRREIVKKWQKKWEEDTGKAAWTKRVIKDIEKWTERKHGQIDHGTTQLLTGHGNFKKYLKRFKIIDEDECEECNREEDVEHVFFECSKWEKERQELEERIGESINPDNIVENMLENEEKWKLIAEYVGGILREKDKEGKNK